MNLLTGERIAHFLASNDEDNIKTDLRKLNGKTGTSFTDFWNEVKKLFTEYEVSVQEIHGSFLYLPLVISIRELIDRVMKVGQFWALWIMIRKSLESYPQ